MEIQKTKIVFLSFLSLFFLGTGIFVLGDEDSKSEKNIFEDFDQDGLSNDEETLYGTDPNISDTDGDGYSDGTEVESGYDPLKPAPGDKIITVRNDIEKIDENDSENLTQKLSSDLNFLLEEKSQKNEQINIEDLDAVIEQLNTSSGYTFEDLPEIDETSIRIKEQDYSNLTEEARELKEKEDSLSYLTAVAYIFSSNSPQKISTQSDLEAIFGQIVSGFQNFSSGENNSYFEDLSARAKISLEQLEGIEVPENMLSLHIKGLRLTNYLISMEKEVKITSDDPIKNILILSKTNNAISLISLFYEEVSSYLEKAGIPQIPIDL